MHLFWLPSNPICSTWSGLLPLRLCVWSQSARGCVLVVVSVQVGTEARLAEHEVLILHYMLVPPAM